jgi:hydrogenase maturation factor HypF (carbamoyltransferase family)
MYAATEKKLVWRGAVSNAVDLTLNLEGSEKNIQKFAEKLLKNYPPNAPRVDRQREPNDKRHRNLHAAAHCFFCPQVVHSTH